MYYGLQKKVGNEYFFPNPVRLPPYTFHQNRIYHEGCIFPIKFSSNCCTLPQVLGQLKAYWTYLRETIIVENPISEPISSFGLLVSDPYKSDNVGLAWRDVLYLAWFQTLTHPQIRGVAGSLDWVIWFVRLPFYVYYVNCLFHDF